MVRVLWKWGHTWKNRHEMSDDCPRSYVRCMEVDWKRYSWSIQRCVLMSTLLRLLFWQTKKIYEPLTMICITLWVYLTSDNIFHDFNIHLTRQIAIEYLSLTVLTVVVFSSSKLDLAGGIWEETKPRVTEDFPEESSIYLSGSHFRRTLVLTICTLLMLPINRTRHTCQSSAALSIETRIFPLKFLVVHRRREKVSCSASFHTAYTSRR